MSLKPLLSHEQSYHRRAYHLEVMRGKVDQKVRAANTKTCLMKLQETIALVLGVAIPLIMIASTTVPFFISGGGWIPFAALGGAIVLLLFQLVLESHLYWRKKKEETYLDLQEMLNHPDHVDSLYPVTITDLPKDRRWLSDIVEPDYMQRMGHTYPGKSPRHLNLMTGRGMPITAKQQKRSVVDIETTTPLAMIAAGQITSVQDVEGRKLYGEYRDEINKQKSKIRAHQRELLRFGKPKSVVKAEKKWEAYLTKHEVERKRRVQLKELDRLELEYGYSSTIYQEAVAQLNDAKLNRLRAASLKKRYPFYSLEEKLYRRIKDLRKKALKGANPVSKSLIDDPYKQEHPYIQKYNCEKIHEGWLAYVIKACGKLEKEQADKLIETLNGLDQLQISDKKAYQEAVKKLEKGSLVYALNPVRSESLAKRKGLPIKHVHEDRYDHCRGLTHHVRHLYLDLDRTFKEWSSLPPYFCTEKYQTEFDNLTNELNKLYRLHWSEDKFETFVDEHKRLEPQLLRLSLQLQEFQKVLKQRIKNDVGVQMARAQKKLDECDRVIQDKEGELAALESVPEALTEETRERRSNCIALQEKLDQLALEFKSIESFEKSEKTTNNLNALISKELMPFHHKVHGIKRPSMTSLAKKAITNDVFEGLQRTVWPKKIKIEPIKNDNLFTKKQKMIDRQIANEDIKLQVAHRVYLLVLSGIAQFVLLALTGIFFYWYPNTSVMIALTCIDWTVALSRLGMEFWFPSHDKNKRVLQMQRFLTQHPDGVPIPGDRPDIKRLYKLQKEHGLIDVSATDARLRIEGPIKFKKKKIGKLKYTLTPGEEKQKEYYAKLAEINRQRAHIADLEKKVEDFDVTSAKQRAMRELKTTKEKLLVEIMSLKGDLPDDVFNDVSIAIEKSLFPEVELKVIEDWLEENDIDLAGVHQMLIRIAKGEDIKLPQELQDQLRSDGVTKLRLAAFKIVDQNKRCIREKKRIQGEINRLEVQERNSIILLSLLSVIQVNWKLAAEKEKLEVTLPTEAEVLKEEAKELRIDEIKKRLVVLVRAQTELIATIAKQVEGEKTLKVNLDGLTEKVKKLEIKKVAARRTELEKKLERTIKLIEALKIEKRILKGTPIAHEIDHDAIKADKEAFAKLKDIDFEEDEIDDVEINNLIADLNILHRRQLYWALPSRFREHLMDYL